jgi:hypothetical protein
MAEAICGNIAVSSPRGKRWSLREFQAFAAAARDPSG